MQEICTVSKVCDMLEEFAPLCWQEEYDNSGLIVGDKNLEISSALLCIDVTEEVIDEALSLGCKMIIAHHPLVFMGLKHICGENYVERCVVKAIKLLPSIIKPEEEHMPEK